jgi:antitoxin (DNA-binding transcriptional repressor) of toxin-antitoxin stability system
MDKATASIRELRTDFRAVKRKVEQFGRVIITDHGESAYVLAPVAPPVRQPRPLPDYFARLQAEQPVPLTTEQARSLHEGNRGDR